MSNIRPLLRPAFLAGLMASSWLLAGSALAAADNVATPKAVSADKASGKAVKAAKLDKGSKAASPAAPEAPKDPTAIAAAELAQGKKIYAQRCGACHDPEENRVGPRHKDLFGRRVGSTADYTYYSQGMRRSELVWDAQLLDKWLTNQESVVPGQRMNYPIAEAEDRRLIIAYLRSLSPNAPTDDPATAKSNGEAAPAR
jgi:cytochrome c